MPRVEVAPINLPPEAEKRDPDQPQKSPSSNWRLINPSSGDTQDGNGNEVAIVSEGDETATLDLPFPTGPIRDEDGMAVFPATDLQPKSNATGLQPKPGRSVLRRSLSWAGSTITAGFLWGVVAATVALVTGFFDIATHNSDYYYTANTHWLYTFLTGVGFIPGSAVLGVAVNPDSKRMMVKWGWITQILFLVFIVTLQLVARGRFRGTLSAMVTSVAAMAVLYAAGLTITHMPIWKAAKTQQGRGSFKGVGSMIATNGIMFILVVSSVVAERFGESGKLLAALLPGLIIRLTAVPTARIYGKAIWRYSCFPWVLGANALAVAPFVSRSLITGVPFIMAFCLVRGILELLAHFFTIRCHHGLNKLRLKFAKRPAPTPEESLRRLRAKWATSKAAEHTFQEAAEYAAMLSASVWKANYEIVSQKKPAGPVIAEILFLLVVQIFVESAVDWFKSYDRLRGYGIPPVYPQDLPKTLTAGVILVSTLYSTITYINSPQNDQSIFASGRPEP